MTNRIDACFRACRDRGRKALVLYVCAGDPSLAFTAELLPRLAAAGADLIEVGVPFSDPMADGPVIQAASQRALAAGASLPGILAMLSGLRLPVPLVLFSYYNVLLQYGVERLAAASGAAGVDGWLVVDVPEEETGEIQPALQRHGLQRIPLIAPTTPRERAVAILRHAGGFVYYITVTGVTGARQSVAGDAAAHVAELKQLTALPVVAGFGISSPETARAAARLADGVVVGSALVKLLADAAGPAAIAKAEAFVRSLRQALDG